MYIFSFRFIHSARASQAQILPRVFVLLRGGVIYRIAHRVSHHTRARSHRDASIFRVHSFARSRRRAAVRRTVSVIRVIHGRLHLRAQLHLCDASRRRNASSSVRVRAFDAVIARPTARLSSNQSESKSHRIHRVRDSSVTNEIDPTRAPSSGNRSLAHASSTASTTRQSTRATESSMAVDECGRTTTTHPHTRIHDTQYPINEHIP